MDIPKNLTEFFRILTTRPDLFSQDYRTELEVLLASLPDDYVALNKAISIWCLEHPEVEEAIMFVEPDSTRFPKNSQPNADTRSQDKQLQKADILNAIRQETKSLSIIKPDK